LFAISNPRLILEVLEVDMFLDKACIALGLGIEGLGVLEHGGGKCCFRVGFGIMVANPYYVICVYPMLWHLEFSFIINMPLKEEDCSLCKFEFEGK